MKTNPDEALRFAKETGIDALAISFGSLMETIQKDMYQNLILRD